MTHRVFSRNAGSSRARPSRAIIEQVRHDPWGPLHWGANQPGMQADEQVQHVEHAKDRWHWAAQQAADAAQGMHDMGLHKQVVNRVLEPYTFINVVDVMTKHLVLRALLPQQVTLSEEDELRLVLWKEMHRNHLYASRDDVRILNEKLQAIPLHQEITEFLDKLIANPFLSLIDPYWLDSGLLRNRKDPVFTDQCATFVKSILN